MDKDFLLSNANQNQSSFIGPSILGSSGVGMRSFPSVGFNPYTTSAGEIPGLLSSTGSDSKNSWKYKVGLEGTLGGGLGLKDYHSRPTTRFKPSFAATRPFPNNGDMTLKAFGDFRDQYRNVEGIRGIDSYKVGLDFNGKWPDGPKDYWSAGLNTFFKRKQKVDDKGLKPKAKWQNSWGVGVNGEMGQLLKKFKDGSKLHGNFGVGLDAEFPTDDSQTVFNVNPYWGMNYKNGPLGAYMNVGPETNFRDELYPTAKLGLTYNF